MLILSECKGNNSFLKVDKGSIKEHVLYLDMSCSGKFGDLFIVTPCLTLTLSQIGPSFYISAIQVFKNSVGKGEIACNKQFLLFP